MSLKAIEWVFKQSDESTDSQMNFKAVGKVYR